MGMIYEVSIYNNVFGVKMSIMMIMKIIVGWHFSLNVPQKQIENFDDVMSDPPVYTKNIIVYHETEVEKL